MQDLILRPSKKYRAIKDAFSQSYDGKRRGNRFTKVTMDLSADLALRDYFTTNLTEIERWFNVISPANARISELKGHLYALASKNWEDILQ